jgi:hypothetical protein
MTGKKKKPSGGVTAAEFMAELEADPEYVRERDAAEAERQARERELDRAEQPIVADLRRAGFQVDSVSDLASNPYPDAVPVLLDHLQLGGYPDVIMDGLARTLAAKPAGVAWETLRDLYLSARPSEIEGSLGGEMEGLAAGLAASATARHLDDMIALLDAEDRGDTRIHFLRAIKRVGGARGLELVESLRSDPTFGPEAQAILKRRR